MRVPISFALTFPDRPAVPASRLDLAAGLDLRFEAPDAEDVPAAAARAGGRRARRHLPVRLQRRQRGRGGGVPRRTDRLPRDRRHRRRRRSSTSTARPRATSTISSQPTRRRVAPRSGDSFPHDDLHLDRRARACSSSSTSSVTSPRRLRCACDPASSTSASHPQSIKRTRNGIEYGIGMIPLGGFVKIPGMHRPGAGRRRPRLRRARSRRRPRSRARPTASAARSPPATTMPPVTSLARFAELAAERPLSEQPPSRSRRASTDIGDALGPDAYWRARTWKRVLVIFAGPAANIVFAVVLFTGLFMTSGGKATTTVDSVRAGSAAAALGLRSRRPDRLDQRRSR